LTPGGLIAPPLAWPDLNVALREPGYSRKGGIAVETITRCLPVAITSLCCHRRPNTSALDTSAVAED
jgi:dihydroorotase